MLNNRARRGNRSRNQHSFKLNSLVIFPWFDLWYVFVTVVFEAVTERNAHDIQEENLNDVDDQNSFILALQLHPLERNV